MRLAIGLLELNSIAKGIEATDAMMKAAFVKLLGAHPICPGKYLIMVSGEVGDVRTSMEAGRETGDGFITDELLLADVHASVFPAITGTTDVDHLEALGIVETFSCPSCVVAADAAAKAALVTLIEIRLASGLGGKAFFTLTGEVGAVKAAMTMAEEVITRDGFVVSTVIIPSPHEAITDAVL